MSDVPIPPLPAAYWLDTEQAIDAMRQWAREYGDARAAEARRLALLKAADIADTFDVCDPKYISETLRALADEASPKSVSG